VTLHLSLHLAPPCDPGRLEAIAERLLARLFATGGAAVHALDPTATARLAEALRAREALVRDVSTAGGLGGLLAVSLSPQASDAAVLGAASAAVAGNARVLPVPDASPPAGFDRLFAVVSRTPSLTSEAIASVDLARDPDGQFDRILLQFRAEVADAVTAVGDQHLGRHLPILDPEGRLLAAPRLGSRMSSGQLEIRLPAGRTGDGQPAEVARALGAGPLPSPLVLQTLQGSCGGPLSALPRPW
jgi:hypothetical protein